MRIGNLISGGCSIDEEERKVIQPAINKVYDSINELIDAVCDIRKDTGMSKEQTIALIMHDVEWTVQELTCDAECEGVLDEYAAYNDGKRYRECMDYYNHLKDSHEMYVKRLNERLAKED